MKIPSINAAIAKSNAVDQKVNSALKNHGKVEADTFVKVSGKPGHVSNNGLLDTVGTLATGEVALTTSR